MVKIYHVQESTTKMIWKKKKKEYLKNIYFGEFWTNKIDLYKNITDGGKDRWEQKGRIFLLSISFTLLYLSHLSSIELSI